MSTTDHPTWVGTSWKMTKTLAEARDFVDQLHTGPLPPGVQPFLLPPHTALATVRDRLPEGSPVLLGAQDAHWSGDSEWTGEVSMAMVADAGARIVEIGHSERRTGLAEDDAVVARKMTAATASRLIPLLCVGEPLAVREAGDAERYVGEQLTSALAGLTPAEISRVLIAYEPVWAIGARGRPARPEEVAGVLTRIAQIAAGLAEGAAPVVLYGGGVHTDNAAELLALPSVGGLFVGRAAWTAAGFAQLLQIAAHHRCVPA